MSKYQTMPPLSEEDAIALEKSIRTHGVQVPVLMDEEYAIIDGHHRWEIATRCGIPVPTEVRKGLTEEQKIALSISLNRDRRQLTRQQKRDIIIASLKAEPAASNVEHARRTGASDKTVQTVRADLEARSEIPNIEERIDSAGRTQPATKPERPVVSLKTKEIVETTGMFDVQTGEVIEPSVDVLRAAAESSQQLQDGRYVVAFLGSLKRLSDVWAFDAERLGQIADRDVIESAVRSAESLSKWVQKMERAARGLRVIKGGK